MPKPRQPLPHHVALLLLSCREQLPTIEVAIPALDKARHGTRSLPCEAEPVPSKIAI